MIKEIKAGGCIGMQVLAMASKASVSKPWDRGSYVNSTTGALAINPIHLFRFSTKPILIRKLETGIFLFAVSDSRSINLYLTSAKRLDQCIEPGVDHMFMIYEPDSINKTKARIFCYLVLRQDKNKNTSPPRFQLLTSDIFLFEMTDAVHSMSNLYHLSGHDKVVDLTYSVADIIEPIKPGFRLVMGWNSSQEAPSNFCKTFHPRQLHSGRMRPRLLGPFLPEGAWQQIFPFLVDSDDLYTVILLMCRALDATRALVQRRDELLKVVQRFSYADILGNSFKFKFDYEDWIKQKREIYFPASKTGLDWLWMSEGSGAWYSPYLNTNPANVSRFRKKSDS